MSIVDRDPFQLALYPPAVADEISHGQGQSEEPLPIEMSKADIIRLSVLYSQKGIKEPYRNPHTVEAAHRAAEFAIELMEAGLTSVISKHYKPLELRTEPTDLNQFDNYRD